jgi:hypothetical protein
MTLRRLVAIPATVLLAGATLAAANVAAVAPAAASAGQHAAINCEYSAMCAEVANSSDVFGSEYVGHDEPSAVFYSNVPGAGNHMTYSLRLPRDPPPNNPNKAGRSYQFELNGAIWFGMALYYSRGFPVRDRVSARCDTLCAGGYYIVSPPSRPRLVTRFRLWRGAGRCSGASGRWPGAAAAGATSAT